MGWETYGRDHDMELRIIEYRFLGLWCFAGFGVCSCSPLEFRTRTVCCNVPTYIVLIVL